MSGEDTWQGNPSKWLVLILVTTGTFVGTLDISIIDVALPTLTQVFRTSITVSQWFLLAYALTNTFLLPAAGRCSDLYGRRTVYVYGLLIFAVGSLVSGMSFSPAMLIITRAFQGIGSSVLIAGGPPLIIQAFREDERGRALGLIGVGVGLGMLAGPMVGGLLVHYAGWRWIFFINVPTAIAAAILTWRAVPGLNDRVSGRLDLPGTALLAISLTSALLALTYGQAHGWSSPLVYALFAVGAISAVVFIVVQGHRSDPIFDLSFFRDRNFSIGVFTASGNYAAMIPTAVFTPFYAQNVLGYSPDKVGIVLASGPAALVVVAPLAGILSDRMGSRFLTTAGLVVTGFASLLMRGLTPTSHWWDLVWRLVLVSVGSGFFVTPNARSIFGAVGREHLGVAAGILSLFRDLGIVLGAGLAAAIIMSISPRFSFAFGAAHGHPHIGPGFLDGLRTAFLACAAIAFLSALVSAFRKAD